MAFSLMGGGKKPSMWKSLMEDDDDEDDFDTFVGDNVLDEGVAVQRAFFEEECARPTIQGVLAIKVCSAVIPQEIIDEHKNLYWSLMYRNFVQRTTVVPSSSTRVAWDQIKHFPVRLVKSRANPFNLVKVELLGLDESGREKAIGATLFHMHDIVKASPISGQFDIWGRHFEIGQIELEITFSYGVFGYGSSVQLELEDVKPEEAVQYSLMPRINPLPEHCEPDEAVLAVQAVPHPAFIPFSKHVHLSYAKDLQRELDDVGKTMYMPAFIMQDYTTMEHVRHKYSSIPDRSVRLMFLHTYLQESSNRPETVTDEREAMMQETFPRKTYTRFVVPATSLGEPEPVDNYLAQDRKKGDGASIRSAGGGFGARRSRVLRTREMMAEEGGMYGGGSGSRDSEGLQIDKDKRGTANGRPKADDRDVETRGDDGRPSIVKKNKRGGAGGGNGNGNDNGSDGPASTGNATGGMFAWLGRWMGGK
ncbi:hypothetical protein BC831DRAFT_488110 [Entophlyctis helioformis]|nr:hypothetical protein BC831DRAFT_488110 [Entophlyctis helioformis]